MEEVCELRVLPQICVEWKINNFFDLPKNIDYLVKSRSFSLCKAKWHLRLYPNGESVWNSSGWLGLYLRKEDSESEYCAVFKLEIKKPDGTSIGVLETQHPFGKKETGRGSRNFFKRSALLSSKDTVTPHDTLTLLCSVRIVDKFLVQSTTEAASQTQCSLTATVEAATQTQSPLTATVEVASSDGVPNLIENFKDLYLNKRCADVRIIVKDKEFLAHRNVLTARSTVFSAMLNCDMTEKNSGVVEITDCDPHSFDDFLLFLYTGDLDAVSITNAKSLYETSEKYDLKDLKAECVRCMIGKLNVDSFCDVLHLASMYNETDILTTATNYFLENTKDILVTLKWQNFNAEYPLIGNELFLKYVNKK